MTTEEDFQRALDANPDDHQTRLVFADWLQEHDDPRAEGYRALGTLQKQPVDLSEPGYENRWSFHNGQGTSRGGVVNQIYALPQDWLSTAVEGTQNHNTHYWLHARKYNNGPDPSSRQEAEDIAALAFSQLPQQRRAELLGQQSAEKLTRRRMARKRYGRA